MTVQQGQSPIFVLSAERSGSTLLRYILDSHTNIGSPGEIALGQLCSWLMHALPRLRPNGAAAGPVDTEAEVLREARRFVDGIMNAYLERAGKPIWCDKTPLNLSYLPWLAKVFPEARFICLYRSCLDTVYSCLEASQFGFMGELQEYVVKCPGNLVQAMVQSWVDKNTRLLMFEVDRSRACHRIRYEDLVSRPEQELMQVCRFLQVAWEPAMVTKALQLEHYQGGGDGKIRSETEIHQRSVGRGKQIRADFLHVIPPPLLGRANELSRSLGYEPVAPAMQRKGRTP